MHRRKAKHSSFVKGGVFAWAAGLTDGRRVYDGCPENVFGNKDTTLLPRRIR